MGDQEIPVAFPLFPLNESVQIDGLKTDGNTPFSALKTKRGSGILYTFEAMIAGPERNKTNRLADMVGRQVNRLVTGVLQDTPPCEPFQHGPDACSDLQNIERKAATEPCQGRFQALQHMLVQGAVVYPLFGRQISDNGVFIWNSYGRTFPYLRPTFSA